jgi:3-phenylpropionate/cinnamic acid dioxygenase small subunit
MAAAATADAALYFELATLYARYASVLDDGPLQDWPGFFTSECMYQVVPRDNFELGLPVAIMRCESRGMLEDRVTAVTETMLFEPRYLRHHITDILVQDVAAGALRVRANFSVIEVLPDELPRISIAGHYRDQLVREADGQWRFREKLCVFDSVLIPNSIVYPV